MFGLFSRSKQRRTTANRQARLSFEALEARDCPAAPQITFEAAILSGTLVQLSGTVIDENPASVLITFTGVVATEVTPDSNGDYGLLVEATGLGAIFAQGMDAESLASNIVERTISSSAPTLTLSVSYGTGRMVTLSGQVSDEEAGGRTVTFSGAGTGATTTEFDGTFSLMIEADQLGLLQATTTDPWGQASNTAQVTLASNQPVITDFQVICEVGVWHITGQVTDESAAGLVVHLGGLPSLEGMTVTVDESGWFSVGVQLGETEEGTATAQVTDWWGLESDVAECIVRQP